jgi:hypothetical protein
VLKSSSESLVAELLSKLASSFDEIKFGMGSRLEVLLFSFYRILIIYYRNKLLNGKIFISL